MTRKWLLAVGLALGLGTSCHASSTSSAGPVPLGAWPGLALAPELGLMSPGTDRPYGLNPNPPQEIPVTPLGESVAIPPGRGAVSIFVHLPAAGGRGVQFMDIPAFRKVLVTIVGENITQPGQATIPLRAGSSGSGTVVVNAGRNQIITATAVGDDGVMLAQVKGVVTSLAGKVVNADVMYGTFPLAETFEKLDAAIGPEVSAAAVKGVIDPITAATESAGKVTYATHPLFIDSQGLADAVSALVAGGKAAGTITADDIRGQLGQKNLVLLGGSVNVRFVDPAGAPQVFASLPGWSYSGFDKNGDGVPDATSRRKSCPSQSSGHWAAPGDAALIWGMQLSDPHTERKLDVRATTLPTVVSFQQVAPVEVAALISPPFNGGAEYGRYHSVTSKPYLVPFGGGTAKVRPGQTVNADIPLRDVSMLANLPFGGGGFILPGLEWVRIDTEPGATYRIAFDVQGSQVFSPFGNSSSPGCETPTKFAIFDNSGGLLLDSAEATGSFEHVSGATGALRMHTSFTSASVQVSIQRLGQAQSMVFSGVDFAR